MSEIQVNKIKPALNTAKVVSKSGIQINDSRNPLIQIPFEITTDGKTALLKEVKTDKYASPKKGEDGQVLLSRGNALSPVWGPIPTSPCPPVPEVGKIFSYGNDPYGYDLFSLPFCAGRYGDTLTQLEIGADSLNQNWKILSINGFNSGAGITEEGYLYTWGYNNTGRIGNGFWKPSYSGPSTTCYASLFKYSGGYGGSPNAGAGETQGSNCSYYYECPFKIGTQNNWKDVFTTNEFTIAIKTDGTLWIWGSNDGGVFGNGTYTNGTIRYPEPVRVGTDSNWSKLVKGGGTMGATHIRTVAVIKDDGTLWTWGESKDYSPTLGYSAPAFPSRSLSQGYFTPKQVLVTGAANNDWESVWITSTNLFAIKKDGSLWGCGSSDGLMVGWNTYTNTNDTAQPPVYFNLMKLSGPNYAIAGPVAGKAKWKKITQFSAQVGWGFLGLQEDGSVWVWGFNGQFSTGGVNYGGGFHLGIGPTNPITGVNFSNGSNGDPLAYLWQPVKLDNEIYLDIGESGSYDSSAGILIRMDGTLWIIGAKYGHYIYNSGLSSKWESSITVGLPPGPSQRPINPPQSRGLIWRKAWTVKYTTGGNTAAIAGIGEEIPSAPVGSTTMWLRRGYTSLKGTTGSCGSSTVKTNIADQPSAPAGWVYCDGTNGTVNMKSYINPVTNQFDWPPIDNTDGCGENSAAQNGTISGQITYIQKT
jgi:alpha-tubulin suppressor-like RCC1 family protein